MVPLMLAHVSLGLAVQAADLPPVGPTPASSRLAEAWLRRVVRKLPADKLALVKRAQSTLLGNLVTGAAWTPFRGVMPSLGTYRGVWNWDSAFHAVGLALWDPNLARDQIRILFDKQLPTGALPDVIFEDGRIVTNFTKPPVMAWAVEVVDRRSPDTEFLKAMYPKLIRLGEFFEQHRGGDMDGLFFYGGAHAGMDSGWDNAIRWDGGYVDSKPDEKRLWAVDLNCYMVSHYRALASIARRIGDRGGDKKWRGKAETLAKQINDRLWDDAIGAYVDRDRVTHANGPALSPATFMPLFVHIAPPERAARLAKLAEDPSEFYPGMPTAAYSTTGYDSKAYWRGPMWVNVAFFALKGLLDYGYRDLAERMRSNLVGWMEHSDGLYEYYDSRSGKGLGARDFGWSSAFALSFVFDWDNNHLTRLFGATPQDTPADGSR
jgi:putative isomerase